MLGHFFFRIPFAKDLSAGEAVGAAAAAVPGAGARLQPTEHALRETYQTAISNSQAQILVLQVGETANWTSFGSYKNEHHEVSWGSQI